MRPGKTVFMALAALCLCLTGCGRSAPVSPAGEPEGPGITQGEAAQQDEAMRWADGYCSSVSGLVDTLATMPVVDPSSQQRAFQTSGELLGAMVSGLDRTLSGLGGLPPSPVAGADKVRADALGSFTAIRDRTAAAKQRLEAAQGDPAAGRAALNEAQAPLADVSRLNLLAGFETSPELTAASSRAPACLQLSTQGPSASLTPPPTSGR
ncbi:hypothetical protein [Amycolatopsis nigrescens]|uniref:hypothetical protein n=1 Tax=Amycolatopsis nigrescens TaxID=381445 RepID=UPI003CCC310B